MTIALPKPTYGEMSDEKPPDGKPKEPGNAPASPPPSDLARMKRALMVYKNWIWSDGIEIARLRYRLERLERGMAEIESFVNRILIKSDN